MSGFALGSGPQGVRRWCKGCGLGGDGAGPESGQGLQEEVGFLGRGLGGGAREKELEGRPGLAGGANKGGDL